MTRLSLKYSLVSLVVIMIIIMISIITGVIVPSVRQIMNLRASVQETQQSLEQEYKETRSLRRSVREVGDIRLRTALYRLAAIAEGQELAVITELENIASKYNIIQSLQVNQVDPKKGSVADKKSGQDLPHYVFSFVNQGTFANHLAYLKALEELPYYITIDHLSFERPRSGNNTNLEVVLKFQGHIHISPFDI